MWAPTLLLLDLLPQVVELVGHFLLSGGARHVHPSAERSRLQPHLPAPQAPVQQASEPLPLLAIFNPLEKCRVRAPHRQLLGEPRNDQSLVLLHFHKLLPPLQGIAKAAVHHLRRASEKKVVVSIVL